MRQRLRLQPQHLNPAPGYAETDIAAVETLAVDTLPHGGFGVVGRTRIEGKNLDDEFAKPETARGIKTNEAGHGGGGEINRQPDRRGRGETTGGVGEGIGPGKIGLHIEDRGAVEEVVVGKMEGNTRGGGFETVETDDGKPDGVGAEVGAGGKDPDPFIAPKPGGADGGVPRGTFVFRNRGVEQEDDPEMAETLQAGKSLGTVVGRKDFETRGRVRGETRLTGNAEFLVETGVDPSDGLKNGGGRGRRCHNFKSGLRLIRAGRLFECRDIWNNVQIAIKAQKRSF